MLKDRFGDNIVITGRNDPDELARLSETGEWRVVAQPGDLEGADAPLAGRRQSREMFRIVSPVLRVYDDGAVESVSQHVLKAIYLKIILSLLTKLDVQLNWCGAGAQRIDAS